MYQIKGDVDTIERTEGRTEVLVDDGTNTVSYNLDEALTDNTNELNRLPLGL